MALRSTAQTFAFILIVLTLALTSIPVGMGEGQSSDAGESPETESVLKGDDFTHSVMMELFVTTWCDRCPTAEEASTELNLEYGENFYYVSMICDVNDDADSRSEDYYVETYPTAVFDGGDEDDRGSENDTSGDSDKERYEDHVEACGSRDVSDTPVTLTVDVADGGGGNVDVSYSATYTGNSQWLDAHLRVYVTEQTSRHMNLEDEPIPYGFLDYAFDEDVQLYPQIEQTESTSVDTDGGEFDNIIVIAALFDKRTGMEGYTIQSASTEEYGDVTFADVEHSPEEPPHNKDVTVSCKAIGNFESIYVEVAACTADACLVPRDVPMEDDGNGGYIANIGSFDDDITIVHYRIVAEDSTGGKSRSPQYDIEFGEGGGDDGSGDTLMYGGGAVAILLLVLGGVFYMRNANASIDDDDGDDLFDSPGQHDGTLTDGFDSTSGSDPTAIHEGSSVENDDDVIF
jgi:hypothetical protein